MEIYLSTEQAAAYLGIKERKLYELVAEGAVPCSKVTGKWIFPRAALDRWVESGLARPAGLVLEAAPAIVGGSHDPLLEWALRQSGSGLALLSEGSLAGFRKLEANAVGLAASISTARKRRGMSRPARIPRAHRRGADRLRRARAGLASASGQPQGITNLADLAEQKARLGLRQSGAGAQQLAEQLFASAGLDFSSLTAGMPVYPTGDDLAYAIRTGEVDCGIATRAAAKAQGLDFVSLAWEKFDLAMRRRTYFEPGPQKLFALMRSADFARRARSAHGLSRGGCGVCALQPLRINSGPAPPRRGGGIPCAAIARDDARGGTSLAARSESTSSPAQHPAPAPPRQALHVRAALDQRAQGLGIEPMRFREAEIMLHPRRSLHDGLEVFRQAIPERAGNQQFAGSVRLVETGGKTRFGAMR